MKSSTVKKPELLKVGIVLDDSLDRPDGVQQYVKSLGNWLLGQGHVVHYLVGQSQSDDKVIHSLSRNIRTRFNQNRLTIPLPASKKRIQTLLAEQKYDVLHIQMPFSPLLAGRVIQAAPVHTAVVGTFHILPFGRMQKTANKALAVVQKSSLRRFDAICSVSSAAAQFAKETYSIESHVIPNMIDLNRFASNTSPHPGRIVFLGRLVARKGCQQLLEALQMVDYTEVIIAGDGPMRSQLEGYAKTHLKHVTFLGRIDESQKADLLASAQIAVFPSLGGESFGIVLIEAMAAGSGVVLGGNNPGYATVLAPWPETLVDPRNAVEFAKTLSHYLQNTKTTARTHTAQARAVKQYDCQVAGASVLDMYRTALQTRRNLP